MHLYINYIFLKTVTFNYYFEHSVIAYMIKRIMFYVPIQNKIKILVYRTEFDKVKSKRV